MARRPEPEKLDKTAKIKLIGSIAALAVAGIFLLGYFMDFSLFGDGRVAGPKLTPTQEVEIKQKQQQIKKQVEDETPKTAKPPVVVGS